jgi:hypothetical protein
LTQDEFRKWQALLLATRLDYQCNYDMGIVDLVALNTFNADVPLPDLFNPNSAFNQYPCGSFPINDDASLSPVERFRRRFLTIPNLWGKVIRLLEFSMSHKCIENMRLVFQNAHEKIRESPEISVYHLQKSLAHVVAFLLEGISVFHQGSHLKFHD